MKRWVFGAVVLIAVGARCNPWGGRATDVRVEGLALGDDLSVARSKFPELQSQGERWSYSCPHRGTHHTFESWALQAHAEKVVNVRGWHLQVGSHVFAPLEPKSLMRLQTLLGPGVSAQPSIFVWPRYHLKVFVDGHHDSVTMAILDWSIR